MKIKTLLTASAMLALPASADVIISEYVEGGSFNKAVELFNTGSNSVDLSTYQLKLYFNGKTQASVIALTGAIGAKQTYVIAHSDIDPAAHVDFPTNKLLFNGDDAVVLENDGAIVDSIGKVGQDPGSEWGNGLTSTKDNSIVRNANILTGDTNPFDDFDPAQEWTGFAKDTIENLGQHTADGGSDNGDGGDGSDNGGGDNGTGTGNCGESFTAISAIQGTGTTSPLAGQTLWVEGIVTSDLQAGGYKGFFIQSADSEVDNDNNSSEALFVYHSADDVNVGDRVRIQAVANEYRTLTQLSTVSSIEVCQSNQALPTATVFTLPANDTEREALEGMRVTLSNTVVTDTYNYGRYGQFSVASERLFNPTQVATPGAEANALSALNKLKSIAVDDGLTSQNPESLPAPAPELSAVNSLRSGDTIPTLSGILSYHFDQYVVFPSGTVATQASNPRTMEPKIDVKGNVRVASFNVLNYFNGNGQGGGYPTARGAKTEQEFIRQRDKVIEAIYAINADVVGLMEIENDGYSTTSAIADLVNGLNAKHNANVYAFVAPANGSLGDDAIAVGLIYKSARVSPKEAAKILDTNNSPTDEQNQPLFLDNKNRPMLTQVFTLNDSEQQFAVAVNHLKSKGSDCDNLNDPDLHDGQGNCNITRTRAAKAIGQFLNNELTDVPTLVIGDLNSYAKEAPLTALADAGFVNVFDHLNKTNTYSYIYQGELGHLDHALANDALKDQIVDVTSWAINADEPRVLDYSMQNQQAVHHTKFYAPDMYRSSDHDPVVIELNLVQAMFGDLDADQDVDRNDLDLFLQQITAGELTDMRFDFNNDNTLDRRDVRGFMQLCTRSRCATE